LMALILSSQNKSEYKQDILDAATALKLAAEQKKPILADFAGSDWCGWCIKLDKEVFSQKFFKDYAAENFVLLLVDFPSQKKLSDAQTEQNESLARKYGVRGFPTVVLLDANGKELDRTGYRRGGPKAYVTHLKDLIGKAPRN